MLKGLDPAAVSQLEARIGAAIERLQGIVGADHAFVSGVQQSWQGADADGFVQGWRGQDRPALDQVIVTLGVMGEDLRKNRLAQEETSESLGGSGSAAAGGAAATAGTRVAEYRSDRLDAAEARQEILAKAGRYLDNASGLRRDMPNVAARLEAWYAELDPATASPTEVATFERYLASAKVAFLQQITIRDSATFGIEQYMEAAKAGGAAISGGVTFEDPDLFADELINELYGSGKDQLGGAVVSELEGAANLGELAGDAAVQRYFADADSLLVDLESSFRSNPNIGHSDPFDVMRLNNDVFASEFDQAIVHAEHADAFTFVTGDGSVLDGALRSGLKFTGDLVTAGGMSKSLDAMAIAGSTAQAKYHIEAGAQAMTLSASGIDRLASMIDGSS